MKSPVTHVRALWCCRTGRWASRTCHGWPGSSRPSHQRPRSSVAPDTLPNGRRQSATPSMRDREQREDRGLRLSAQRSIPGSQLADSCQGMCGTRVACLRQTHPEPESCLLRSRGQFFSGRMARESRPWGERPPSHLWRPRLVHPASTITQPAEWVMCSLRSIKKREGQFASKSIYIKLAKIKIHVFNGPMKLLYAKFKPKFTFYSWDVRYGFYIVIK